MMKKSADKNNKKHGSGYGQAGAMYMSNLNAILDTKVSDLSKSGLEHIAQDKYQYLKN